MAKVTREVIDGLELRKQRPDLFPTDPLLAAIGVAGLLTNVSENLIRLADKSVVQMGGKLLKHGLPYNLQELIGLINLMEDQLEASDGWEQLALLYDANGVEFEGRHAGSFALVAFDYAYELSVSFAGEVRTAEGKLRKTVDVARCITEWNRIRQQIQAMPRIQLPQLATRVFVEEFKLTQMRNKRRRPSRPTNSSIADPTPAQIGAVRKVLSEFGTTAKRATIKKELQAQHGSGYRDTMLTAILDKLRESGEYDGQQRRRSIAPR